MLHRASIVLNTIIPNEANNYKIIGMLKTIKIPTVTPTCFGSGRNHHQGAVLCLAKTTEYGFFCARRYRRSHVTAAYQGVVRACGEPHARTTHH